MPIETGNLLEVRDACVQDATELAKVHLVAWRKAYHDILPRDVIDGVTLDEFEHAWFDHLKDSYRTNLICQCDGSMVGFVGFGPALDDEEHNRTGEIYGMYVDPSFWRKGAGTTMWSHALEGFAAKRLQDVVLWVHVPNQSARKFYERVGFHCEAQVTRPCNRHGVDLTEVRYRRSI